MLDQTEKNILLYAKATGRTKEQAMEAINRYRFGVPLVDEEPQRGRSEGLQVLTGAAKGIGSELRGLQDTGATIAGAILPGVTGEELRAETAQATEELTGVSDADLEAKSTAESLGKGAAIAATVLAPSGLPQKAATKGVQAARTALGAAKEAAPSLSRDFAFEAATPKITQKTAVQAAKRGERGVTEPTLFKAGEFVLTPRQELIQKAVSPIVQDAGSPIEATTRILTRIGELDARATKLVSEVNPIFNRNQLRTFLGKVKDENKLVFASDPQAEKIYDAAIDALVTEVKQGNASSLFEARKAFDKLPAVRKLLESAPAGENLRRAAVLDVRRAANDFLEEIVPEGSEFRALLKEESLLFDAVENLAVKYGKTELTKSKIRQMLDKVPIVKGILANVLGGGVAGGIVRGGIEVVD